MEVMEDTVAAERETAESDYNGDEFVQPACPIGCRKTERRRHEDDRMVCVVELDAVPIDETDGCIGAEGRDGELF